MKHRVVIDIPIRRKLWVFFIERKKKIGLSFDNYANLRLIENTGLDTKAKLDEWAKNNGTMALMLEYTWAAAESYALHEKKTIFLTHDEFLQSLTRLDKATWEKIQEAFSFSQAFGMPQAKKKTVRK